MRDKRYAVIGFTNFLLGTHLMNRQAALNVISSLIILACKKSSFQIASSVQLDTEDLLNDSYIDQTFAF